MEGHFSSFSTIGPAVTLGAGARLVGCQVENAEIGPGASLVNCVIRGRDPSPAGRVIIGARTEANGCVILNEGSDKRFSFGGWFAGAVPTAIGEECRLDLCRIVDSAIGEGTRGEQTSVVNSTVGSHNHLRPFGSLVLSRTAERCELGSELSKTVIDGAGFVSEHGASYLSLVAPSQVPVLDSRGDEWLVGPLPNLTNIGAGTVFANYGGNPLPADALEESTGSQKGTAVVLTSFVAINARVINRYGGASADDSLLDLVRRPDLTVLGFCSFVEGKVVGRIPAFSHAGDTSPSCIRIGWVLDHQPGILLTFIKKMRKALGGDAGRLHNLVEGAISFEIRLLEEELEGRHGTSRFGADQLEQGVRVLRRHLDGRWSLDEKGEWRARWTFDQKASRWAPRL